MSDDEFADEEFEDFEEDFEEYVSDTEEAPYVLPVKQDQTSIERSKKQQELSPAAIEVMRVMTEENNAIFEQKGSTSMNVNPSVQDPHKKTIVVSKPLSKEEMKQQEMARKRADRARELLRIVELEKTSYIEYLDLPPKSEMELYQLSFGVHSTHSQTGVQCPPLEDSREGSTMTDRIVRLHKGMQAPDDLGLSMMKKSAADKYKINPVSLSKFLKNASNAIERLIEEKETIQKLSGNKKSVWKFSESFSSFFNPIICSGRSVLDIVFLSLNEIAACYSPTQKKDAPVHNNGLVCVWSIASPNYPSKILVCETELTCISFVPHHPHLLVAGTCDGSLQLWDLRESEQKHREIVVETSNASTTSRMFLRNPTYATDWMLNENHYAPVKQIVPLGYNKCSVRSGDSDQYQISSLDQEGTLIFWLIVNLSQETISDTDLGLSMGGGRVKLANGGRMNIFGKEVQKVRVPSKSDDFGLSGLLNNDRAPFLDNYLPPVEASTDEDSSHLQSYPNCTYLECEPRNSSQFIIGLASGTMQRGSKFPKNLVPKVYHFRKKHMTDIHVEDYGYISNNSISATCIHYSIFLPQHFLASFSDGSVGVYVEGYPDPLFKLTHYTFRSIKSVQWSPYVPSQFYVLAEGGELFLFDLLKPSDDKLVFSQNVTIILRSVQTNTEMQLKPSTRLVFPQFEIHNRLLQDEKDERRKRAPPATTLVIGYSNGRFDLHSLNTGSKITDSRELTADIQTTKQFLESLHVWNVE